MRVDCIGIGGWLFGHQYEPRMTATETERVAGMTATAISLAAAHALATLTATHYHGDVCTRCGHTINEPPRTTP